MATLKVVSPFTVQLDPVLPPDPLVPEAKGRTTATTRKPTDPTKYVFPVAGTYNDVPDEVATHPYTLPHLAGYEPPELSSDVMMADTVIMQPVEEPPPTQEEAAAVLNPTQREEIARRRVAETTAAATAQPARQAAPAAPPTTKTSA